MSKHPVRVHVNQLKSVYVANEYLACTATIEPHQCQMASIEASVMWTTEGKGDQDLGVHYFERKLFENVEQAKALVKLEISTQLPASPISYRGQILKINWSISFRIFLNNDKEFKFDFPFRLVSRADLA